MEALLKGRGDTIDQITVRRAAGCYHGSCQAPASGFEGIPTSTISQRPFCHSSGPLMHDTSCPPTFLSTPILTRDPPPYLHHQSELAMAREEAQGAEALAQAYKADFTAAMVRGEGARTRQSEVW
jgi:hypothetical protein